MGWNFAKGPDHRRKIFSDQERLLATLKRRENFTKNKWPLKKQRILEGERTSKWLLRKVLLEESPVCNRCRISEWIGEILILEIHHKDGDPSNHTVGNAELLCPNCHSLTPNHRNKKRSTGD